MATEEPSVIAAASNGAKICGNICAETPQRLMRGQIVLSGKSEYQAVINAVNHRKEELILCANESYPSIVKRGAVFKISLLGNSWGVSMHTYLLIFSGCKRCNGR